MTAEETLAAITGEICSRRDLAYKAYLRGPEVVASRGRQVAYEGLLDFIGGLRPDSTKLKDGVSAAFDLACDALAKLDASRYEDTADAAAAQYAAGYNKLEDLIAKLEEIGAMLGMEL